MRSVRRGATESSEEAAEPEGPAATRSMAMELTISPCATEILRVLVVSLPAFYFE
jgi:hypothetical protein